MNPPENFPLNRWPNRLKSRPNLLSVRFRLLLNDLPLWKAKLVKVVIQGNTRTEGGGMILLRRLFFCFAFCMFVCFFSLSLLTFELFQWYLFENSHPLEKAENKTISRCWWHLQVLLWLLITMISSAHGFNGVFCLMDVYSACYKENKGKND